VAKTCHTIIFISNEAQYNQTGTYRGGICCRSNWSATQVISRLSFRCWTHTTGAWSYGDWARRVMVTCLWRQHTVVVTPVLNTSSSVHITTDFVKKNCFWQGYYRYITNLCLSVHLSARVLKKLSEFSLIFLKGEPRDMKQLKRFEGNLDLDQRIFILYLFITCKTVLLC